MKFTEEQYQKIVDIWNNEYAFVEGIKEVFNYIEKERLANTVYESAALANPVTREWAHEQYVEKEKEYFWTNKNIKGFGLYKIDGVVFPKSGLLTALTISEVREWGYNPEMFDKEEVE